VADLSFIGLALVLPALQGLLAGGSQAEALLLVKPQFEVGRERVGKGGVVRDPLAHESAIAGVVVAAGGLAWGPRGLVGSPITGAAGNHEYLLWLGPEPWLEPGEWGALVKEVVASTTSP
jgi:23S rRNA (cytidine1920-2'-O)/16S rRNA (cytidine1409-2'-O)-methyltransferase